METGGKQAAGVEGTGGHQRWSEFPENNSHGGRERSDVLPYLGVNPENPHLCSGHPTLAWPSAQGITPATQAALALCSGSHIGHTISCGKGTF